MITFSVYLFTWNRYFVSFQVDILEQGLQVHKQVVSQELTDFHKSLETVFKETKTRVLPYRKLVSHSVFLYPVDKCLFLYPVDKRTRFWNFFLAVVFFILKSRFGLTAFSVDFEQVFIN